MIMFVGTLVVMIIARVAEAVVALQKQLTETALMN